jgi:hypothetical protein
MLVAANSPRISGMLILLLALGFTSKVNGQEFDYGWCCDSWKQPLLPPQAILVDGGNRTGGEFYSGRSAPRCRLFRMPTGFINDPVGLDSDDDNGALITRGADATSLAEPFPDIVGANRVGLALGTDNPHLDFREPGDPGGLGFYKVHTQWQLLDDRFTCMSLGLQAFAPAGLEADGASTGPTVLTPNLAWYHEWESGPALQGFVGKNVWARPRWLDHPERSLRYGIALQSPSLDFSACSCQRLCMFLEALGSSRRSPGSSPQLQSSWGLIPGVYWQLRDNWWMSSGVALPVGTTRYESGQVHITCSWRF